MTNIQKALFGLRDEKYAEFQAKLTPTVPKELFIGVRVPLVRNLAKGYIKNPSNASLRDFFLLLITFYLLHISLIRCRQK